MQGPFYNQDDSEFCYVRGPENVSAAAIDEWVDGLAKAGVGTLICCVNAQTANYPSKVWEHRWDRYDPNGPDDQPVLKYQDKGSIPAIRRWVEAEKKLADMGVTFHERALARCRQKGVSGWLSIRMNDLHDCHLEDSILLSTFFKEQRAAGKVRVPYRFAGWTDRALDWTRPEVRDHYLALVVELLESADLDGLDLDWMRFGYHFPVGRELEGGAILTEWLGEVRRHCSQAAQRLGHPVRLGVRVPSTPETARRLGLDGAAWAKAGLVDLVVPTPFWQTTEFDMPMDVWKRLLDGTGATLAGGLEVRYQSWRGGPAPLVTPEVTAGLATNVLAGGADAVYLFNYFLRGHFGDSWSVEAFDRTIGAMRELKRVAALPRRHGITFRDVRAPGEPADDQLPASGAGLTFRVCTGPRPVGRAVEALVQIEGEAAPPNLRVNSVDCGAGKPGEGGVFTWALPAEALAEGYHVLELTAAVPVRVVRVEVGVQ